MYIVDTNVLMSLNTLDGIIDRLKEIYIPVEVLSELDKHKTAEGHKGFQARRAIRNINQNLDKYQLVVMEDLKLYKTLLLAIIGIYLYVYFVIHR